MPDLEKKHIIKKIKEIGGIIAAITDRDFSSVARENFHALKSWLQLELQAPLDELKERVDNPLAVKSKQLVKTLKTAFSPIIKHLPQDVKEFVAEKTHSIAITRSVVKLKNGLKTTTRRLDSYFSTTSTEDIKLRIELITNLFFLFNLFEIKATNQLVDLDLIWSNQRANLEKLKSFLIEKCVIYYFNKGYDAVRDLRGWAELADFSKNDPLQIYLYALDLFLLQREINQEIRDSFLTCIKEGNKGVKKIHVTNHVHFVQSRMSVTYFMQNDRVGQSGLSNSPGIPAQRVSVPARPALPPPVPSRRNSVFFPQVGDQIHCKEPSFGNTAKP